MAYNMYDLFNKPSKRRKVLKQPPRPTVTAQKSSMPSRQYLETPAYLTQRWTPEGREKLGTARSEAADRRVRAYGELRTAHGKDTPETTARIMSQRFETPYAEEFQRYAPPERFAEYEELQRAGRRSEAEVTALERTLPRQEELKAQADEDRRIRLAAETEERERIAAAEGRTATQFERTEEEAAETHPLRVRGLEQELEGAPIRPSERYERMQGDLDYARGILADPPDDATAEWAANEVQRLQGELSGMDTPEGLPQRPGAPAERFAPPPVPSRVSPQRFERDVGFVQNMLTATGLSTFISAGPDGESILEQIAADAGSPESETPGMLRTLVQAVQQALSMAPDDEARQMIKNQVRTAPGYAELMNYLRTGSRMVRHGMAWGSFGPKYWLGGRGRIGEMKSLVGELQELVE